MTTAYLANVEKFCQAVAHKILPDPRPPLDNDPILVAALTQVADIEKRLGLRRVADEAIIASQIPCLTCPLLASTVDLASRARQHADLVEHRLRVLARRQRESAHS